MNHLIKSDLTNQLETFFLTDIAVIIWYAHHQISNSWLWYSIFVGLYRECNR